MRAFLSSLSGLITCRFDDDFKHRIFSNALGFKLDILIIAPIAVIYASIVAMITEKFKFNDILNSAVDNVKEMQLVFLSLCLPMRWPMPLCLQESEPRL